MTAAEEKGRAMAEEGAVTESAGLEAEQDAISRSAQLCSFLYPLAGVLTASCCALLLYNLLPQPLRPVSVLLGDQASELRELNGGPVSELLLMAAERYLIPCCP